MGLVLESNGMLFRIHFGCCSTCCCSIESHLFHSDF